MTQLIPRVLGLASVALFLGACRSVPDVTRVPVPSGATVLSGQYAGTLTEGLFPQDALISPSGDALYVMAQTSSHTTLLVLDPATGQERRRAEVAVNQPRQLAWRGDGRLILAGWSGSGALDPQTLQLTQNLPGAERVSVDGETLLEPTTVDSKAYVLRSSRTGAVVNRVAWPASPTPAPGPISDNLNWAALGSGSLLNLKTGQRVDRSAGHPDPCGLGGKSLLRVMALADVPDGVALAFNDGTVEWRTREGGPRSAQDVGAGCAPNGLSEFHIRASGARVLFQFDAGVDSRPTFGEIVEGQAPVFTFKNAATDSVYPNWFDGTFAYGTAAQLLFADPRTEPILDNWRRWKQSYPPTRFPVSASVQATYRDGNSYDITGRLQGPTGSLTLRGTGSHTGQAVPGIVFTQALCSVPPFGPNCPTTAWEAELSQGADRVGSLYGYPLDPNAGGPARRVQNGAVSFQWDGEMRSFGFELNPR